MIHLPTSAGGRVEHVAAVGSVALRGALLARVHPGPGVPVEEIAAPFDGLVAVQRLEGEVAPRYAYIIGLRRVVVATCAGRVRWLARLGPLGVRSLVALVAHEQAVRPHRAGAGGFVGERFTRPGARIELGAALIEIRSEELA